MKWNTGHLSFVTIISNFQRHYLLSSIFIYSFWYWETLWWGNKCAIEVHACKLCTDARWIYEYMCLYKKDQCILYDDFQRQTQRECKHLYVNISGKLEERKNWIMCSYTCLVVYYVDNGSLLINDCFIVYTCICMYYTHCVQWLHLLYTHLKEHSNLSKKNYWTYLISLINIFFTVILVTVIKTFFNIINIIQLAISK